MSNKDNNSKELSCRIIKVNLKIYDRKTSYGAWFDWKEYRKNIIDIIDNNFKNTTEFDFNVIWYPYAYMYWVHGIKNTTFCIIVTRKENLSFSHIMKAIDSFMNKFSSIFNDLVIKQVEVTSENYIFNMTLMDGGSEEDYWKYGEKNGINNVDTTTGLNSRGVRV